LRLFSGCWRAWVACALAGVGARAHGCAHVPRHGPPRPWLLLYFATPCTRASTPHACLACHCPKYKLAWRHVSCQSHAKPIGPMGQRSEVKGETSRRLDGGHERSWPVGPTGPLGQLMVGQSKRSHHAHPHHKACKALITAVEFDTVPNTPPCISTILKAAS